MSGNADENHTPFWVADQTHVGILYVILVGIACLGEVSSFSIGSSGRSSPRSPGTMSAADQAAQMTC